MPILNGAVAYRVDSADEFESEIEGWEMRRPGSTEVSCPKECDVTYGLIVQINSSDEQVADYARNVTGSMEQTCPKHPVKINIR